ncbi:hypothetical protein JTB14_022724 [Gonioctena quinquepunctata]|nr:hypothetical protein JTB14_022724 [Gonioctena quinquepunctata]
MEESSQQTNFSKLKDRKNRQKKYRERVFRQHQHLILEYSGKNITPLQEPVKTLATPKANGSSGAIGKTKIINKNVNKVRTRSTNERRNYQ